MNRPITLRATQKCLVCEQYEDEKADMCNDAAAWLCPECKRRMKKMLYDPPFEQRVEDLSKDFYTRLAKTGRLDLIEP